MKRFRCDDSEREVSDREENLSELFAALREACSEALNDETLTEFTMLRKQNLLLEGRVKELEREVSETRTKLLVCRTMLQDHDDKIAGKQKKTLERKKLKLTKATDRESSYPVADSMVQGLHSSGEHHNVSQEGHHNSGCLYGITGRDYCPGSESSWKITEFMLGVMVDGKIVGNIQYDKKQRYPIMGQWGASEIVFRAPYNDKVSGRMLIYTYHGNICPSSGQLQGDWYCESMPDNAGHRGTFKYNMRALELADDPIPRGEFSILGREIAETGGVWVTPKVQVRGHGERQFSGEVFYETDDGFESSPFLGDQLGGAIFTFQLKYDNDVYVYRGMRYGDDILGSWVSMSEPHNAGKRGSFAWKLVTTSETIVTYATPT